MAKNKKNYLGKVISYLLFGTWTFLALFPLVWLILSSFKTDTQIITGILTLPTEFHFTNYISAWKLGKLGQYFYNSFIYTFFSTGLTLLFAMMTSYALAKMPAFAKVSKVIYGMITLGLLITIHALIIPLFMLYMNLGLIDTRLAIIMTYIALGLPMAIYLGSEYMKGLPDSLIESAYMDGASNARMFLQIILPMCKPVLVSMGILNLLQNWNEFLMVFILTSSDRTRSLPVGVYSFSSPTNTEYGMQFAALVIATLPILIIYSIYNKRITEGVVAGSVKG